MKKLVENARERINLKRICRNSQKKEILISCTDWFYMYVLIRRYFKQNCLIFPENQKKCFFLDILVFSGSESESCVLYKEPLFCRLKAFFFCLIAKRVEFPDVYYFFWTRLIRTVQNYIPFAFISNLNAPSNGKNGISGTVVNNYTHLTCSIADI